MRKVYFFAAALVATLTGCDNPKFRNTQTGYTRTAEFTLCMQHGYLFFHGHGSLETRSAFLERAVK